MEVSKAMSTASVPPQFLRAAYLVGSIPFKTLRSEPRVSYTLYIPEKHYCPTAGGKERKVIHRLSNLREIPLVVNIHGTRRGAERCRDSLISFADETGITVLAPLFPAGIGMLEPLHNYKVLRQNDFHADKALLDILDEVRNRWPRIATQKVVMIGFSGGAQFVHRFMYLYPERLHAVSIGAPGRVTKLDWKLSWPAGVMDVEEIFDGVGVDVEKVRQITIQLVCGALDTEVHGGEEFWLWLREMKARFAEYGDKAEINVSNDDVGKAADRLGGLKRLKDDWEALGIQCQLDVIPQAKHETEKILPAVIRFLRPVIETIAREHVASAALPLDQ